MLWRLTALILLLICSTVWAFSPPGTPRYALPAEARHTLALIDQGGPFPFARDGMEFGNFEHRLPIRQRGYYHEYTVPTPGDRHRGARRIIAGALGERYYTADHYQTFARISP